MNEAVIHIVHAAVPGRTRLAVPELKGDPRLEAGLERALPSRQGLRRARASSTTGNLLLEHEEVLSGEKLSRLVREAIQVFREKGLPETKSPRLSRRQSFEVPEADGEAWHRMSASRCLERQSANARQGLRRSEADLRLRTYGSNALGDVEARSGWLILRDQVFSLPAALLGGAAGLSVLTGGVLDAAIILGVLGANSAIGYFTEKESEKTIGSLKKLTNHKARVLRGGKAVTVPAEEVVPGDVVLLRPGNRVPADCRVIEASGLAVDESALTGESRPAEKEEKALKRKRLPLAELSNMVFMGGVVTGGTGRAVVVATGAETRMGRMREMLALAGAPRPPIQRQLAHAGDRLVRLWIGACAAVFGIGLLRGFSLMSVLRTSVSLAAAAVPEGLPATATTTFALGVKDMKRHNVLVRNLHAVDTLGSVGVVCFDKTGTITENRMSVMRAFAGMRRFEDRNGRLVNGAEEFSGDKYPALHRLLEVGVLCSEVKINGRGSGPLDLAGTPTESALVRAAEAAGLNSQKIRKKHALLEVNYRTEKASVMGTLHRLESGRYFHEVKGRPSEVLARCSQQIKNGELAELSEEDRGRIMEENRAMAGEALRVLGMAGVESPRKDSGAASGLTWYGLIGLADPIRDGVGELIEVFHDAGIRTVMITGDQTATALAVARRLGLTGEGPLRAMDADELTGLDFEELTGKVEGVHVFSRVSPGHKLRIVKALQAAGATVAMTGDGVNDGPALKAADVGIAMGEVGTDVTREAADVVLGEDDLETLVLALRDGRVTYANIKKAVRFFLSTNLSETMIMFAAMTAGAGAPLNPMQLMWINVISDIFPGLALSLEPAEPGILDEQPRDPEAPLFNRREAGEMLLESGIMSAASLGVYALGAARGGAALGGGMAFQTLTVSQLLHALTCRSGHGARRSLAANPWLVAAVGGSLALQAATFLLPGLRGLLGMPRLGAAELAVSLGGAAASFLANESVKTTRALPVRGALPAPESEAEIFELERIPLLNRPEAQPELGS